MTLLLLCSSLVLLSLTADDYVECSDSVPDELFDIFGLVKATVELPVVLFFSIFLLVGVGLFRCNLLDSLRKDRTIASRMILSTVIRI